MSNPYRFVQVGTGGQGARWCRDMLPPNVDDGLVEPVAAVDVDEAAHENAREGLGLDDDQLYTDYETAFAETDADFATVVIPPEFHEAVVDAAVENGLHVLSEKPIADTLAASVRIAETVREAGLKMGVTMTHRFRRDVTTLRRLVRAGDYGPLDYLVCRFTCNARSYGSWGASFRHEMDHALLVEGGVHHLDILADVADAPCERLYSQHWTPDWGDYGAGANALVTMTMANGVEATYEGAKTNAVGLNGWEEEYVRAECRDATLILSGGEIRAFPYDEDGEGVGDHTEFADGDLIPLDEQEKWGNVWLVEQFVEWLDGGPEMPTNVRDNLQSMALVEAAIESGEANEAVAVQELLAAARDDGL
ncbi:MAG: Gfo/Idh/MocA family protein [Halobacteriaceae archaeon]